MARFAAPRVWAMRLTFTVLVLVIVFFQLLPLTLEPSRLAPPDLILAFAFAWAVRRPEAVPAALVAGLVLLCDFLFQRGPGLWSALVVIAIEWAKTLERRQSGNGFVTEWLNFAVAVAAVTVSYRLFLALTVSQTPPFFLLATSAAFTIAVYPLVVLATHFIFRVRRTPPGDVMTFG